MYSCPKKPNYIALIGFLASSIVALIRIDN